MYTDDRKSRELVCQGARQRRHTPSCDEDYFVNDIVCFPPQKNKRAGQVAHKNRYKYING